MEEFEKLKSEILSRAKENGACVEQYKRAYNSTTARDLCDVIKDNFDWCCRNGVLDGDIIEQYKELFWYNKIYHNESVSVGYMIATGNATVEAYGNATVEAYDSATVKAYGNATVEAYDSATVIAIRE